MQNTKKSKILAIIYLRKDQQKKSKQKQLSSLCNSENEVKPQNMLFSKKAEIENKNCTKNLLEDVKQPHIKLQRIDEVINKIAQSFARVTPIKECETIIQTETNIQSECETNIQTRCETSVQTRCDSSIQTEEIQTELSISAPEQLKLSSVNINTDKYQQNLKTETIAIRSHANETLQLNKCADSVSDLYSDTNSDFKTNSDTDSDSNTGNSRNTNERRHRITYNSHAADNNRYNKSNANNARIISNKLKRLTRNSLKQTSQINLVNEKYNIIKERCTDKNSLSQAPQRPSILDRISALCDPDDDDDDESIKEGNTSSCVPSKLNLECMIEDGTSVKGKNEDAMTIEKSIVENKKIEEQIQESFPSNRNFTQRYKLFKELKVFLIKFDALKDSNTTYSATEIEKMTERFTNSYVNLNSSKLQNSNEKSINNASSISIFSKDSNVNIEKSTDATKHVSSSSIDSIPNKDIYTTTKRTQSTIKLLSNSSEKLFPNLTRNAKIQQERSSQIQKVCHNLTKIFEDSSKKRFAQNTISNAKQKLIVPTPTIKSTLLYSSQKPTNKNFELSNVVENIDNINKSTGKTFSLKRKISEISSPKENSMKLVIDARSQEQAGVDTSSVTNFKLHLSKKNKKHESEKHIFAPKTCRKTTNVTTTKIATKKSASTSYSSILSPKKHKRLRDNHGYKCIVCDLCFEDYPDLQQHLITHTQKQNNSLGNSLKTSNMSPEKSQDMISQSSKASISEPSKVSSKHKSGGHTASQYVTKKDNGQQKKKDAITKSSLNKEKSKKRIKRISNSNKCSICSKPFETMADLAAHIFLHTEKELQQAYKLAKQKLNGTKKYKQTRTEQTANSIKNVNSTVNTADNIIERTQKVNDKEETLLIRKPNKSLITEDSEIRDTESIIMKENYSQDIELCQPTKSKKGGNKYLFTVCECHNKPGTNENCLQIEIVLLCHTCRVIFRSMKCFETHYRLPQYVKCNQNRLTSGRSPNLFCATCGMIFSSVQDVRHHLEMHARFKKDCTMDFRCNICKVIFLGIGSLFYIHWSKHSRDPFWMASEKSFPKDSIINLKLRKAENSSTQNAMTLNTCVEKYIEVAEHVCYNCKLPFISQDDLKNHISECRKFKAVQNASIVENSNTYLAIRITCNLCDDIFINKKTEFYKHIKDKHNLSTEPRFICTSLTAGNMIFICSVCTAMTKSLDDFEDHWLKHNTTHVYFTCSHCSKIYHNSLNSFINHAKKHGIDTNDVVSCVVSYKQTEFTCKFCNIGFDSHKNMQEHAIIHDTNSQQISPKISQVTNQDSSATASETDCASNFAKLVEVTIEKRMDEPLQMETQKMDKASEICPIESNIDNSTDKLIKILEGNEDDSEHELIIDLTKQSEECNEGLKEEGSKERQTTSNLTLDKSSINQTCVMSENNKANALVTNVNIQVSSQNVAKSKTQNVTDSLLTAKNINPQISNTNIKSTNILQTNNVSNHNNLLDIEKKTSDQSITKDIESTQNVEVHDRISIINQEESTILTKETSEKQSPPRPRQGFLRVKTLAELTGSANLCELSNSAVENANELAKHSKSHHASNKDNNEHKTTEKEIVSKQSEMNKFIANNKLTIIPNTNLNTLLLSSSNSGNIKLLIQNPVMKPNTTIKNNQQPQQFQINTNQKEHSSSLENVTSAYHKNLPACNFVRTTTAMPRFTILKPTKVIAHSANIPNVQRTHVASCSTNENRQKSSSAKNNSSHTVHKCKHCNFASNNSAEFLMHNLPGNRSTCKKQYLQNDTQEQKLNKFDNSQTIPTINTIQNNPNPKRRQQTTMKQPGINYASSSVCDQYSYLAAGTSNNSNQILKQNQPIITNHPITENTTPIYYKNPNPSSGGMSIVINQTTPTVQSIPTIGILQQPAQQQIYQQQDLIQFSKSNAVFQLANQPSVRTYQVRYVCPYCSKSFVSEDYMQIHINEQHNFICNICSLRLYSFNDLNLHKIQHNLL
ncbi:uncharacterized protein LOC132914632 [Bombus pascuorum]|uniref:uncharacterized protein LOC132914632 n=1 Tax=Bombus pascuorum TaxID=65598 RepID=UPI00298EB995|nr:uncharacterized protein LOC132914632 [Bombus pascuorum]